MNDRGKIIAGLVIGVGLLTFPVWYAVAAGGPSEKPKLVLPAGGGQCVADTQYMRDSHMGLLNEWRDKVVREGQRYFTAPDGKKYEMSLTNTCLSCHDTKATFCDRCHDYVGIRPFCWDCHIDRKGP